jgi:DNA-binding SARP family transcriptional activator/tetratricopeptide (TPR) repeat protein/TolB-like protein
VFTLRTLGGASIEADGRPLHGRAAQRRRLALLALLAVARTRGMSREKLIGYLWPETTADRARHLLSESLYVLRKALGENAFVGVGSELRLNPEVVKTDVGDFEDARERGNWEMAAAAYGGPFLDGFYLDGAPEFERWMEAERDRLARAYREALETLAEEAEERRDSKQAAQWWLRAAAVDPASSRIALRLMEALAAAGDRTGAIRHAQVHTALLREEYGAAPNPDVVALAERLRIEPPPSPPPPAPPVRSARPRSGTHDRLPTEPARVPSPPPETVTAPSPHTPPHTAKSKGWFTWRVAFGGAAVFLLLGFLFAVYVLPRSNSLIASGALGPREPILVADFRSPGGDSLLAAVVTDALRIDLSQSPLVTVVERGRIREALTRMKKPDTAALDPPLAREIALREGIHAVLSGEVAPAGAGFVISARLLSPDSEAVLAAFREAARDSTELIPAIDRLSRELRERIGEPLRSIHRSESLARVTTGSLEALRKYSQATHAIDQEGNYRKGVVLLEEALELDPGFAMAYRKLGTVLANEGDLTRATEMYRRAYQHRDRLTERERYLTVADYHEAIGEWEEAITAYRMLLDRSPSDWVALNNLGLLYEQVGDYERAVHLYTRAVEADSSSALALSNLVEALINLGELNRAAAANQRFMQKFPTHPRGLNNASRLAAVRGDYRAAEAYTRALREEQWEDTSWRVWTTLRLGHLAAVRGKLIEAERHLRDAMEEERRSGTPAGYLEGAITLGMLDLYARRAPDKAVARIERALADHPLDAIPYGDRPYVDLARLYAETGDIGRARALLEQMESSADPRLARLVERDRRSMRAALALAEGRVEDAISQLRTIDPPTCPICELPYLGRAYEQAGQPDSAIAVYERYISTPYFYRIDHDAVWLPYTYERLVHLLLRQGDEEQAARYARKLATLWRDADPELRSQVMKAR